MRSWPRLWYSLSVRWSSADNTRPHLAIHAPTVTASVCRVSTNVSTSVCNGAAWPSGGTTGSKAADADGPDEGDAALPMADDDDGDGDGGGDDDDNDGGGSAATAVIKSVS